MDGTSGQGFPDTNGRRLRMLARITIEGVRPSTPNGFPAKAVDRERVAVRADVFRDGHDVLAVRVRWRRQGVKQWRETPMHSTGDDAWAAEIEPEDVGMHEFRIEAFTDRFASWRHEIEAKAAADADDALGAELEEGALLLDALAAKVAKADRPRVRAAAAGLRDTDRSRDSRIGAGLDDAIAALVAGIPIADDFTRSRSYPLWVDRRLGRAGGWYEMFPRSEGGFHGATGRLQAIADMGFDVLYLPPIHPIGVTNRKGRGNTLLAGPGDPGSPWAIGSEAGGHTAIDPDLGSEADFLAFVDKARGHGLEVALDYALQCSPDHPWVRDHPEWFHHRPDGTIKFAENPPKKYQDIVPIAFYPPSDKDRQALWHACKDILEHWMARGIRIFRVDNPHTKPLAFWAWLIAAIHDEEPDVLFLAEAFTTPKMMARLAEVGFTQSYTYFTWRTARWELEQYVTELATGRTADYMRPNFWPNTPDILSGPLRDGPPAAFMLRYVLAVTMSPAWGIYSGYELGENEPASADNEEYAGSEKYECKSRDWDDDHSLVGFVTSVNWVRRAHAAFDELRTIRFHETGNDAVIAYSKSSEANDDRVLVVVNLDPFAAQEAVLSLDMPALGRDWDATFAVRDELTSEEYRWGRHPYVRLDPATGTVAHLMALLGEP
jgi:starch synthase (maltosyl-transferring)